MRDWFSWLGISVALTASATAAEVDARLEGYRTPPGWKVELAATEPLVVNPVTMTFGLDGRLFVVEWQAGRGPNDHIKVLTDRDEDGAFDHAEIYMDNLELPAGVLFWDGWTYVTLDHDVVRFRDDDHDGRFERRETIVTGFGNDDSHHRVSGMIQGPDGWLYLTTGDSDARARGSDGSTATVLRCGGVFRCKPDGSSLEVVAFGMRNPWGNVAFDDAFRVFHTDNDNEGSPGFTGCRLLHVVEGGDYGWRLRDGARCCQPDFERATWNGGRPGRLGSMAETGRGAPAGLCVLSSSAFPDSQQNLLIYPDVFRKSVRAYRTRADGASFRIGEEFELLVSDEPLFRPTDAEVGPDGALYILDWRTDSGGAGQLSGNGTTGRIYRMTWAGTDAEPAIATKSPTRFEELRAVSGEQLARFAGSADPVLRRVAGLELIRRGRFAGLAERVLDREAAPASRRQALMTLAAIEPRAARPIWMATDGSERDANLRRIAYDTAARFAGRDDRELARALLGRLPGAANPTTPVESDPEVLRSLILALGRLNEIPAEAGPEGGVSRKAVVAALLDLYGTTPPADAFLRDAFPRALEQHGSLALAILADRIAGADRKAAASALEILQAWRTEEGLATVLRLATSRAERTQPLPGEPGELLLTGAARANLFRALRELNELVPPEPIAGWLASSSRDPEELPRVEAVRLLVSMKERAAEQAGPIVAGLLADPSTEVRTAALGLAALARSPATGDLLLDIVADAKRPTPERSQALVSLRRYDAVSIRPRLNGLVRGEPDPAIRAELLRTLSSLDFEGSVARVEESLDDPEASVRQTAIALLGQRPETALGVVKRYNAGKLPPQDLARVIEAVRPHATPELQEATQLLLKSRLLNTPTGAEADRLREFVRRQGNAERGKAIYLDMRKGGCTTCHRLEGVGGSVGPDLTRLWQTLSFDKRVESLLDPSKEIKEGYQTFKVATVDGKILTGLLLSDTPEAVVLRDAQGQEVRVPAEQVEQKGADPLSLMPVGVVGHLSFSELADLLAFLGDRTAQESLRP